VNLDVEKIKPLVESALKEDIGEGDITSRVLVPSECEAKGVIIAEERGIIAGIPVAELVFKILGSRLRFKAYVSDGDRVDKGKRIAEISGEAGAMLAGERVALNFLGHLSGIATKTGSFVEKTSGLNVKIMDTRKTLPGLRMLEKYAVGIGGGYNHRMGLYDAVLIKDNHIELAGEKIGDMVKKVRSGVSPSVKIEVEAGDFSELREALIGSPDIIMLDNMTVDEVKEAVDIVRESGCEVLLEVSGGIKLGNVREYAETGVDTISVGELTHSVQSLDISMEMGPCKNAECGFRNEE